MKTNYISDWQTMRLRLCAQCPGTGFVTADGRKCFNQYQLVRACPAPSERFANGAPLRPPLPMQPTLAKRPAPAPVSRKPKRVPFDPASIGPLTDPLAIADYVRAAFRSDMPPHAIAATLNQRGAPAPNGDRWRRSDVLRVLLARKAA
jgi:hypothetical protein